MAQPTPTPPPAEAAEGTSARPFPQEALKTAALGRASLPEVRATLTERAKPYLDELKEHGFPNTAFVDKTGEQVQATYGHDGKVMSITATDPATPYGEKNFHQFVFNQDGTVMGGKDWDNQGNGEMLFEFHRQEYLIVSNHDGPKGEETMIRVPYQGDKPLTPQDIMVRVIDQ